MTVKELRERVKKAQETVEKRKQTIERHKVQAEKKLAVILKHPDWDVNNRFCKYGTPEHNDCYWAICEYESKLSDIKGATKNLEDAEKILSNWKDKLEAAEAKENCFITEIPKALQNYKIYLVEQWDEFDKKRRQKLSEEYKQIGYTTFIKKYKYSGYEFMSWTDEQIHKDNERTAETLILDLYYRVKAITGKITGWNYLTIHNGHINGWVEGEDGVAKVESILAGGYNIQRLHIRVLVHKIDRPQTAIKEYSDMTIEELEEVASNLGITPKQYDNKGIYRMRLVMAIKAGARA